MRSTRRPQALLAVLLLPFFGCGSPSAPAPVDIALETVHATTVAEQAAWPSNAVASGGPVIEIRGTALAGCGTLLAEATRRERSIQVQITSVGDRNPCELSRPAWQQYVARISAVPPGEYRLRLNVVGHNRRTLSGVKVSKSG